MICPNCHVRIRDDSEFCEVCGQPVRKEPVVPKEKQVIDSQPEKKEADVVIQKPEKDVQSAPHQTSNQNEEKGSTNILQIIVGAAFIVAGMYFYINAKSALEYVSFGGDFYTYTYHGIYGVAELLVTATKAIGVLISAVGALICFSARK